MDRIDICGLHRKRRLVDLLLNNCCSATMRAVLTLLLLATAFPAIAASQEPDSVRRLKEALGPPRTPPLPALDMKAMMGLRFYCSQAPRRNFVSEEVNSIKTWLFSMVVAISPNDMPSDPWADKHRHFQVTENTFNCLPIDAGLVMLHLKGRVAGLADNYFDKQGHVTAAPILIQIRKNGSFYSAMGSMIADGKKGGVADFEIINERTIGAEKAILVFVKREDRSWVMYRDATNGKPLDQFVTLRIDEQSLIANEKAKVERQKAADEQWVSQQEKEAQADRTARMNAFEADRLRIVKAKNEATAREVAIEETKFRKWRLRNGDLVADAKLLRYANGTVTLQDRSGKQVKTAVETLCDEDARFIATWRAAK